MPAPARIRPSERAIALTATLLIQLIVGAALLRGLRVALPSRTELIERLIEVPLSPPPRRLTMRSRPGERPTSSAPRTEPRPIGGSAGPQPSHVVPTPPPIVAVRPAAAASGGGQGQGPALGNGAGGGSGGQGYGSDDEGGTDLVQIAGAITPSDYPRDLREKGIGGRVGILFTVGPNGRVTSCTVTRSSGVPELDALTCRLIQQRFVYRPSTDRLGRPIPDEVEGEHDWVAGRG